MLNWAAAGLSAFGGVYALVSGLLVWAALSFAFVALAIAWRFSE